MSIWKTQEWKTKAAQFVAGKSCTWCGSTEHLVPHHPRKKGGYTREEYLDLSTCVALCSKCNFMESLGYKICPVCKKKYFKTKRKYKMCWDCFLETDQGKLAKEYYSKHPEELVKQKGIKKK